MCDVDLLGIDTKLLRRRRILTIGHHWGLFVHVGGSYSCSEVGLEVSSIRRKVGQRSGSRTLFNGRRDVEIARMDMPGQSSSTT